MTYAKMFCYLRFEQPYCKYKIEDTKLRGRGALFSSAKPLPQTLNPKEWAKN